MASPRAAPPPPLAGRDAASQRVSAGTHRCIAPDVKLELIDISVVPLLVSDERNRHSFVASIDKCCLDPFFFHKKPQRLKHTDVFHLWRRHSWWRIHRVLVLSINLILFVKPIFPNDNLSHRAQKGAISPLFPETHAENKIERATAALCLSLSPSLV